VARTHGGPSPLPAAAALGQTPVLKEPRLHGGWLYWLEQRPAEQGRTTLLRRPAARFSPDGPDAPVECGRELTPAPCNLRSRVHEYGGGVYALGEGTDGQELVVFCEDRDRCLWRLDLPAEQPADRLDDGPAARPSGPPPTPQRLTPPLAAGAPWAFADGLIDSPRQRWLGVLEQHGRDQLVVVPLAGGEPQTLHHPADFCGYAVLSPSGRHLAWVEWQQPCLPWERSQLWLGRFDGDGALVDCRPIAGSSAGDAQAMAVFQPLWLANGDLVVAHDRSGWWNLERLAGADRATAGSAAPPAWQPLLPMQAEFAMPQWVYGMRTSCSDGERLLAAACSEGVWQLGRVALNGEGGDGWRPFDLPFDDLAAIDAANGRLVCLASSPRQGPGLLELDTASGRWRHGSAGPCPWPAEAISVPEALWFPGHQGRPTHAWLYAPPGGCDAGTPLLVKGHSGPTGMARTGLNLVIQYWTSRGWAVLDVNYGGSTGFGRAYRERLDGGWGVVDVDDCAAAARAVLAAGRASPERVAIEGGSAGGFTVLAALCFTDTFRAGACRYAVTDLGALARDTHRFEAGYLDGLVGPWPAARATYEARSPLLHAERITAPVIFFQGLDDAVVPPEQTERMAVALRNNGVPVQVHLFPGEGHGFRSSTVQLQVLEATEAFFRQVFAL
jgi:dienelactone hydrolase